MIINKLNQHVKHFCHVFNHQFYRTECAPFDSIINPSRHYASRPLLRWTPPGASLLHLPLLVEELLLVATATTTTTTTTTIVVRTNVVNSSGAGARGRSS